MELRRCSRRTERKGSGVVIERLALKNFGRFQGKVLTLEPGLTILYGRNEAGKSTIHAFIRAMLFGIERPRGRAGRDDPYTRYLPWDTPAAFGGSMDFELDGKHYRISRSFHKSSRSVSCICLDTGREVSLPSGRITDLIPELTESLYRNTVSVEQQKARTDAELAEQIRNYIANLAAAGDCEVDVRRALKRLNGIRKQLDAEDPSGRIEELGQEIQAGEEALSFLAEVPARREALLLRQKELARRMAEERTESGGSASVTSRGEPHRAPSGLSEEYPAIREKYRVYQEYRKQAGALSHREQELKRALWEEQRSRIEQGMLRERMAELEEIRAAYRALDREEPDDSGEGDWEEAREERRRPDPVRRLKGALLAGLGMLAAILSLLLADAPAAYLGAAAGVLLAAAGAGYGLLSGKRSREESFGSRNQRSGRRERMEDLVRQRDEIIEECGVSDEESLRAMYEASLRSEAAAAQQRQQADALADQIREMEHRIAGIRREIADYAASFGLSLESGPDDQAMAELDRRVGASERESGERLEGWKKEQTECEIAMEKLLWELERAREEEERLEKNRAEYRDLTEAMKQNRKEHEAVLLAIRTIEELSARIHDSFGGHFGRMLSNTLADYTGGEHTSAYLDEKLNIRVGCGEHHIPLERLSIGTMDQACLALRMSVAGSLLGREDIPLILDDCFAYYDEERLERVLASLAGGGKRQILLFTCQEREGEAADRLGLPHHDICLP